MYRALIHVFLFIFPCVLYAQSDGDFDRYYTLLTKNIDKGDFQANIDLIHTPQFKTVIDQLPCSKAGKIRHLAGVSYYLNYQELEATKYFKQAVFSDWADCKDIPKIEVANTLYNIGVSYQYSTELYKGKEYLDSAIVLLENIENCPKDEIAYKYEGIGYYYVETNNYHRANSYLQQASNLAEYIDPNTLMNIRINLMILYFKYSKFEKAYEVYKATDTIFQKHIAEFDDAVKMSYYLNVAQLKFNKGEYEKSNHYLDLAASFVTSETESYHADIYEIRGSVCRAQKNYACAKRKFTKVYKIRQNADVNMQNRLAESIALHNLSEIEFLEKNYDKALTLIDQSIKKSVNYASYDENNNPILKNIRLQEPLDLVKHLQLKEKIILAIGSEDALTRSLQIAEKIDSIIDKSMKGLSFEKSKLELLPLLQTHTEEAIDVSLKLYQSTGNTAHLHRAVYFSTQAKSYVLQQVIQESRYFHDNANQDVAHKVNTLKSEIAVIQNELLISENDSLLNALIASEMRLEQVMSDFHNSTEGQMEKTDFSIKDIQKNLSDDVVVLDIYEGEANVYFFWITDKDVIHSKVKCNDILPYIDSLSHYNSNPSIYYDSLFAKKLYSTIFSDEIRLSLPKDFRLKVIPEGRFFELNFETLLDENCNFLFYKHPTSYAYHPKFLFKNSQQKSLNRFLGFGTHYDDELDAQLRKKKYIDPSQSLGQLHNAEEEVLSCNEFMNGSVYLGDKASLKNFKDQAPYFDIIYLSLHGLVDQEEGLKTGIAFDNSSKQFVLDDSDLRELRLKSDLIIMSSCHSASGKIFKGEGLKGMTRSFFASGAKNVLSSLWTAGENSSKQILPLFLKKYISGNPMDISLQESKLAYIKTSPPILQHPFYWGNYVVYGAYEKQDKQKYDLWIILGICALLILAFFLKNRSV